MKIAGVCLWYFVLLSPGNLFSQQIITTIAGNGSAGYSGDGGPATSAQIFRPISAKMDKFGNLYVAEEYNNIVRKISPTGIISTVAGNGSQGYSGDGGPATDAQLDKPNDVLFDPDGNLYISETSNKIRRVTPGGIISTFAGTGSPGYTGENVPAVTAKLSDPVGMVFDNSGNLYFSCNGNYRIRKISTDGLISTVAGTGTSGYSGDGGPATDARVRLVGYLALGPTGELFLPDYPNHCVRKVDHSGIITTVIGNGVAGNSGDGGPATSASLTSPSSIVFDQSGNAYVSDRLATVIRKVDVAGVITTIAGTGVPGYSGDGGDPLLAQLNEDITCTYVDSWGNLYVSDAKNNRVRKIRTNPNAVSQPGCVEYTVAVSPNPAANLVCIQSDKRIAAIQIFDPAGVLAFSHVIAVPKAEATIDIGSLKPGIYTLLLNDERSVRLTKL